MPLMKLRRAYRLATTKGHAVAFEKDKPVYVPPEIVAEAVAIGAEAVDGEVDVTPQDPPPKNSGPADALEREKQLLDAMAMLVAENVRENFTAGGVPTQKAMERLLGFEVSRKEINDGWLKRSELINAGLLAPDGTRA